MLDQVTSVGKLSEAGGKILVAMRRAVMHGDYPYMAVRRSCWLQVTKTSTAFLSEAFFDLKGPAASSANPNSKRRKRQVWRFR